MPAPRPELHFNVTRDATGRWQVEAVDGWDLPFIPGRDVLMYGFPTRDEALAHIPALWGVLFAKLGGITPRVRKLERVYWTLECNYHGAVHSCFLNYLPHRVPMQGSDRHHPLEVAKRADSYLRRIYNCPHTERRWSFAPPSTWNDYVLRLIDEPHDEAITAYRR